MLSTTTHNNKTSPITITQNVSLHDKVWFKTGGSARYYCEPTTPEQFQQALEYARIHKLDIFVLGDGANILISDSGFDGLVIRPHDTSINIVSRIKSISPTNQPDQATIKAGAGAQLDDVIEWCLDNGIVGLEEFSGIPGTIGGAVYINIHYFKFLLSDFLVSATVINKQTGEIKNVDASWFNFGYNTSTLLNQEYYVLDATFKLSAVSSFEIAYARGRKLEIIRHRTARYPYKGTVGSFFRNFHKHEVQLEHLEQKLIYIAYYFDKIGIKGALSYGGATVSYQHANMIVNKDNATSNDIVQLARLMQQKVYDEFGIIPQPECQLIGFKEYPLLK